MSARADDIAWSVMGNRLVGGSVEDMISSISMTPTAGTVVVRSAVGLAFYDWNGTEWMEQSNVLPFNNDELTDAVLSVTCSELVIILQTQSACYRYKREETWFLEGGPDVLIDTNNPFAMRLSEDGRVLATSDPYYGEGAGRVRVFRWNTPGFGWVQVGSDFIGQDGIQVWQDIRDYPIIGFTLALSVDGERLAFSNTAQHRAHVYDWDSDSGEWVATGGPIVRNDHLNNNMYVLDMVIAGDILVVAQRGVAVQEGGPELGDVAVFVLQTNEWVLEHTLVYGYFGIAQMPAALISSDGTLVITHTIDGDGVVSVRSFRNTAPRSPTRAGTWHESSVVLAENIENLAFAGNGSVVAVAEPFFDNGRGRVTMYNFTTVTNIPCFHGDTLLTLADGTTRAIRDVSVGMQVRNWTGQVETVRRVTRRTKAACVYFQPDSIAPGVPSRTLMVTPNHLLRHPDGRVMPAGALVTVMREQQARQAMRVRAGGARIMHRRAARCGHVRDRVTVYHIAVDQWTFLRVHNVDAETMAQSAADDRRRQDACN